MKLKQNISSQSSDNEQLPPVLEKLRQDVSGFRIPDGYFDSLSLRIADGIKKQENRSLLKAFVPTFRKPLVWAPIMATVLVAILLIFVIPAKKTSTNQVVDEWTEINMAYDPSYASEALLAESNNIDKAIEGKDINYSEVVAVTGQNEPTNEEIAKYLKEHEIDTDLLNEY
jgi:ornithine carbamoyltransferase